MKSSRKTMAFRTARFLTKVRVNRSKCSGWETYTGRERERENTYSVKETEISENGTIEQNIRRPANVW